MPMHLSYFRCSAGETNEGASRAAASIYLSLSLSIYIYVCVCIYIYIVHIRCTARVNHVFFSCSNIVIFMFLFLFSFFIKFISSFIHVFQADGSFCCSASYDIISGVIHQASVL